jgi:zinc transport system ATP-binding protein
MTEPALSLEGVWLSRRGVPVLEDVHLALDPGEVMALLGPNGSGKTTLLKVVLGLLAPQRGRVQVLGASPARARGRVGYVPQHAAFDRDFPIRVIDVVLMGRLHARGLRGGFDAVDRAAARAALERVELPDQAGRPIGALSGGQLQRVLIARALAMKPRLLLLDEPTASLDERVGGSFWDLLAELSREAAVVIVSHDIGAVSRNVGSVACLNRRLFMHPSRRLTPDVLESAYGASMDTLAHDHAHHPVPPRGTRGP